MKIMIAAALLSLAMTGCGVIDEPVYVSDDSAGCQPLTCAADAEEAPSVENLFAERERAGDRKLISVNNIMQNPELPTGCECVSLTILLNHYGYDVDKLTLAREYQPKQEFYWYDGMLCGADFRTTFAGDPESEDSYGCYAPCIAATANNFFCANGQEAQAEDISGTDFDRLLTDYISNDEPVLIWVTNKELHEPEYTTVWNTPDGEQMQWLAYEHCVVLTGFDRKDGKIYVSDPLVGNTSYSYERIKQRYIDMGQQAVCIDK
ncbi:MAG: C39 family peptidase [Ruminococcus sp.]|nr:C39 family peptidase [Ruminococcus sp.]